MRVLPTKWRRKPADIAYIWNEITSLSPCVLQILIMQVQVQIQVICNITPTEQKRTLCGSEGTTECIPNNTGHAVNSLRVHMRQSGYSAIVV